MKRDEIVEEVIRWLSEESDDVVEEFLSCTKEQLIRYHTGLGRNIRNHFKLWEVEWEPELVNGIDMSQNHPDAISMAIIEDVWEKVKEREKTTIY